MMQCGKGWTIKIQPSVAVRKIKWAIGCVSRVLPDDQHLIFEGSRLAEHEKLSDYAIMNGSTPELLARLTGGKAVCGANLPLLLAAAMHASLLQLAVNVWSVKHKELP